MSKTIDYIIVGHGLAGAVLSQMLLERGKSVMVYDEPYKNQSSTVAAGLFNPVTGRKMVKTWLADDLFPFLTRYYPDLENQLSAKFVHPIGIYRPFIDIAEHNDWVAQANDPNYQSYIEAVANGPNDDFLLHDPNGGLHLNMSGYVDIPALLNAHVASLTNRNSYREEQFTESEIQYKVDCIAYKDVNARAIVFCNGLAALQSKFFHWLPFKPVKGEILNIETDKPATKIYNRGVFLVPKGGKRARAGSTYKNHFEHLNPTIEGQAELDGKLNQLIKEKFKIIDAVAGARPATKDRRPFIGKHFEYEHIYVFNGFGSKGVSLIPFFAHQFVEYLTGNSTLSKEVNVSRYAAHYPKN